ncbi:RNA polymerase sigma factor [Antrihabitans cavernicola]|uniref:RNA polymerase sigma factor n=1 Tax=Antrihabitans cavernicola TaxID=2495913 RepID=A0A5A7SKJ2_9NOCA|nr:RNA polymerase sigma factor [Spelaeibacter cavernicola]KAA0024731.1 RNA polymerase sigma factor [Spelaeibacter cavernicola]
MPQSPERWEDKSDESLVRAAVIGEQAAFVTIVNRYGPQMLRYSRTLLHDSADAEEAVQDALTAAWKGLDDFRFESSLRTWLFTLTAHKVIDRRRKRSVTTIGGEVPDTRPADASFDPEARASNAQLFDALTAALADLPYRQRACWWLREIEGMRLTEIGTILSLSPDAVRGQIDRAQKALRTRMVRWT